MQARVSRSPRPKAVIRGASRVATIALIGADGVSGGRAGDRPHLSINESSDWGLAPRLSAARGVVPVGNRLSNSEERTDGDLRPPLCARPFVGSDHGRAQPRTNE